MASHVLDSTTAINPGTAINASIAQAAVTPVTAPLRDSRTLGRVTSPRVRRLIPPISGYALEKLGHAIEYVTDEYIHEGCQGGFQSPRVEAIQLLMSANREIYYACPIVPSLWERIRRLFAPSVEE